MKLFGYQIQHIIDSTQVRVARAVEKVLLVRVLCSRGAEARSSFSLYLLLSTLKA